MITLTDNQLAILQKIADENNTVYPIADGCGIDRDFRHVIEVRCVIGADEEHLDLDDVQFLEAAGLIELDRENDEDNVYYTYFITDEGKDELRPYRLAADGY